MNPVDREHQRQALFAKDADVMTDLNGGDDKVPKNVSKEAMIPNGIGSTLGASGVMSYHGGKIVSTPLSVYLIM